MNKKIILTPEQFEIVKDILQSCLPVTAKVWVFGSRATGNVKPYSDLDLAIDIGEPLSIDIHAKLTDAFDESRLPFKVDIVDWQSISEAFKNNIKEDLIVVDY